MTEFMEDVASKLEFRNAWMEDFFEQGVEEMVYQVESRCPAYRHANQERKTLEEIMYKQNRELAEKHYKLQAETDSVLLKAAFLLGIKTGIRLAK